MNRGNLKQYAPEARRKFIRAVTDRAGVIGLSESGVEPVHVEGDVAIIAGRPFPRRIAGQRANLENRIRLKNFAQVMEEVAYTWFNRFAALRFMELHGYLDQGYRVLKIGALARYTAVSGPQELLYHAETCLGQTQHGPRQI